MLMLHNIVMVRIPASRFLVVQGAAEADDPRAVDGEVGKTEDPEGDKHPQDHNAVYQPFYKDAFNHGMWACPLTARNAAVFNDGASH